MHTVSITNTYVGEGYVRAVFLLKTKTMGVTAFDNNQYDELLLPGGRYTLQLQLLVDDWVSDVDTHLFTLDADIEIQINNINDIEIK
jgi:hypothetical protein